MLDENIKEQCREIYKNNKNVIEIMDAYKEDFQADIYKIMNEVITDELGLKKVGNYNNANGKGCGIWCIPIDADIKSLTRL